MFGKSLEQRLTEYFEAGIKPVKHRMLGVESEHFILEGDTLRAVSYYGEGGVEQILLRHMAAWPDARPIGGEELLGFSTENFTVTLEPAAQYEVSMAAREAVEEIGGIYRSFRDSLKSILDEYGYVLYSTGCQPVSAVSDLKLIPKKRYDYMDRYFREKGTRGIEMMRGSASTQVSIDYFSEEDFRKKIQAAYLLTPFFEFLSANSFSFQGDRGIERMKRVDIWRNTDPGRCGIPEGLFSPDYGFGDYARWLCDIPLILKQKGSEITWIGSGTARQVYEGEDTDEEDLAHIASMAFPDVRLKQFLEIRGADSLPEERMLSYAALVKGLIYSDEMLDMCQDFIRSENIDRSDVLEAQDSLVKEGWEGRVYGYTVRKAVDNLLNGATDSLPEEERAYLAAFSGQEDR